MKEICLPVIQIFEFSFTKSSLIFISTCSLPVLLRLYCKNLYHDVIILISSCYYKKHKS